MKIMHLLGAALICTAATQVSAQTLQKDYIDWGESGYNFGTRLQSWQPGEKWTDDDNFFIARQRPHKRFRNEATQVNPLLTEDVDKKLIFWVPINREETNALPDGVFDSEVFNFWAYVTHYGDWSARFLRIPGNFLDVAHKNGVPVSAQASIPWGYISDDWAAGLKSLIEAGADKLADYMHLYGYDGVGYNSEFYADASLPLGLAEMHAALVKNLNGRGHLPEVENIWYDGTNETGAISFDMGLGEHNDDLWGYGDSIKSHLFWNYNWNRPSMLEPSLKHAQSLGRSPLDIYCGINMQGREPKTGEIWMLLNDYPFSIGLWGAHSKDMFFESRAEKGPDPLRAQRSYLQRLERWFTGGSRNPLNTPELNNSLRFGADITDFPGMSKMMSARSALKWDLSEEPFISNFNLGNGRFFNFAGERQNSLEWYNIGIQDYMPTWMWWWSKWFMHRTADAVPSTDMDAEFTWDDAWLGGSALRIHGSSERQYLHLFKTEFEIREGDRLQVRYKLRQGSGRAAVVLSAKGSESEAFAAQTFLDGQTKGVWHTRTYTFGRQIPVPETELAMVALEFEEAADIDLLLGEFSIIRGDETAACPATPVIEKGEIMASGAYGADAKLIWNMTNSVEGRTCYNQDVNTSMFRLWARQEGKEPVMMGMTTSWAGMMFSIPVDYTAEAAVQLGVSALSLDQTAESEIAWSEPLDVLGAYRISDKVFVSEPYVTAGRPFCVAYDDPRHQQGDWTVTDSEGNHVAEAEGTLSIDFPEGLAAGVYSLTLNGMTNSADTLAMTDRTFPDFIQVMDPGQGDLPRIKRLTADGKEDELTADAGNEVTLSYEAEPSEGKVSRGVRIDSDGFGFYLKEAGLAHKKPFSISFWFKPETFDNSAVHLLNARDRGAAWAVNHWGWIYHILDADGKTSSFTIRCNDGVDLNYGFDNTRLEPGCWYQLTYVFETNDNGGIKPLFFVNGKQAELTSWSWGVTSFPPEKLTCIGKPYRWTENTMLSIGGYLHNSGSVVGSLDDVAYWNRAITAEEVAELYANGRLADPDAAPDGLFRFESDQDANNQFTSEGNVEFHAGNHDTAPTEVEGQGEVVFRAPRFTAGAPSAETADYTLTTRAEWSVAPAQLIAAEGDATAGEARVKLPMTENFAPLTLTLANDLGSDSRTVMVSIEGAVNAVEEISGPGRTGASVYPNPFTSQFTVTAADAEGYRLALYDMQGVRTGSWEIAAGTTSLTVAPAVAPGLYILGIFRDGKGLEFRKVLKR